MNAKKDYIWNSIAGILNASQAIILGIVITRTNNLVDAGILSLAFAVGNLMGNIGRWGISGFQVSDIKNEFSFSSYFSAHIISAIIMILASGGYLLRGFYLGYSIDKIIAIGMICLIYTVETVENVFGTLYQRKGRLYVGSIVFIVRWGLVLATFSLLLVVFHNLVLASVISAILNVVVEIICIAKTFPTFDEKIELRVNQDAIKILKKCFPLFLVSFLLYYVTSAPKYSIDRFYSDDVQACYGFVAMPVFVIELLNTFLYNPILVDIANEWEEKKYKEFRRRIGKQCIMILGISAICLLGAYILGVPVLSFIFGVDLTDYKSILMILLVAGTFLAFAGFFNLILTIMRKQNCLMYIYIVVAILAVLFCDIVVKNYGIVGGCLFYTALMIMVAGIFGTICMVFISKAEKN